MRRSTTLVGRLLFVEIGGEQPHHVIAAELIRPSNQSAITRDLIVLDRLRRSDDGSIENLLVHDLAGNVVGFRNETHSIKLGV